VNNFATLPPEPERPQELVDTAVQFALQSIGPITGSTWLIDDEKHKEYYIGFRINGKTSCARSGLLKRPSCETKEASDNAAGVNYRLAKEVVNKVNQIIKNDLGVIKAQEQILEIANRAMAQACSLSAAQFLVTWVRPRVTAKNLSVGVALLYCGVIDRLLTILKAKGRENRSLGLVTGDDIKAAMKSFEAAGDGPSTFNKKLSVYRALFNDAIALGYLAINPAHTVKYMPAKSIERLPFTLDEVKRIFDAMDGLGGLGHEWKMASFLSLNLGARRADVLKRRWDEFDLRNKVMTLRPGKNDLYDRVLTLPISEPLYQVLSAMSNGQSDQVVCQTLNPRQCSSLSNSFQIILRRAGIEVPRTSRSDGKGNRAVSQKSFYGFRHTLNLWLDVAGVPREKRKDMLGQTTDKAQEFYRHEKAELLRKELQKVPQLHALLEKFAETATPQPVSYEI
jgi:integrase